MIKFLLSRMATAIIAWASSTFCINPKINRTLSVDLIILAADYETRIGRKRTDILMHNKHLVFVKKMV
jgi:hypothetical protein